MRPQIGERMAWTLLRDHLVGPCLQLIFDVRLAAATLVPFLEDMLLSIDQSEIASSACRASSVASDPVVLDAMPHSQCERACNLRR